MAKLKNIDYWVNKYPDKEFRLLLKAKTNKSYHITPLIKYKNKWYVITRRIKNDRMLKLHYYSINHSNNKSYKFIKIIPKLNKNHPIRKEYEKKVSIIKYNKKTITSKVIVHI